MSKLKRDVQGASLSDSADLFGEWQTEALFIPPVQNGIVPRGPHGNVELWTPAHLPLGATHVEAAHAAPAARQLGFDFVPCMTGFDIRSGRSVPRIEGIVVASEVADVVRDAAAAASLQVSELAAERSRAEAQARWKELIGRVKARQRIQNKYGNGVEDNPAATYATVQERRGVEKCRREAAPAGSSQDPSEAAESRSRSVAKERASADIDSQGEEDPRSTKYSKGTLPSDPHNHAYGPARRHEGDVWIKVCNICGIEVAFEKF
jgi:Rad4 beta-hairpin domain 3